MSMNTTAIPRNIAELNDINDVDVPENAGDLLYYDGTDWVDLPAGSAYQVLSMNSAGSAPAWIRGVPIGTVLPWLGDYTNTPSLPTGWVECSGQTLSDAESVYNGQTIPDLNGSNYFLRGNSTSGGSGGSATHIHSITLSDETTTSGTGASLWNGSTQTRDTNSSSNLPPYYDVRWIMKIK